MIKKTIRLIIAVIISLLAAGCSESLCVDVTAEEGKKLTETYSKVQLIDVREQWEYDSGHIEGSILMPLGELANRIDELDKNQPILLICRTGNRSRQACETLVKEGFSEVYNLKSGVTGWPYGLVAK